MSAIQVDVLLAGIRDASGVPLSAGKIYTYDAGTLTNRTTWTDVDKTTPAANPIILDANGRAQIYAEGNYKFVIKTSGDADLYTWNDLVYEYPNALYYYSGTSGGSSNAYTLTNSAPISALASGMEFTFKANFTNTSSCTLNIDGLGAKTIKLPNGSACIGGEVVSSRFVSVIYDGTDMILTSFEPEWTDYTPTTGTSAGSLTGLTKVFAKFKNYGDRVLVKASYNSGSLATTAANYLTMTLPKSAASIGANQVGNSYCSQSSPSRLDQAPCFAINNTSNLFVYPDSNLTTSGWAIGSGLQFNIDIEYIA